MIRIRRKKLADSAAPTRGVIFDFDGTIADSWPAILEVAEQLMGRTEHYTEEEIAHYRDLPLPVVMKELKVSVWKVPILLFRGRRMLKAHMHGIPVHEGMDQELEWLHKKGVPLYVLSSNATENVRQYLAWHKLSHCFTGVYGGASVFAKAPMLLKLLDREGLDTAGSWYVGDETRDVSAARAGGLKSV